MATKQINEITPSVWTEDGIWVTHEKKGSKWNTLVSDKPISCYSQYTTDLSVIPCTFCTHCFSCSVLREKQESLEIDSQGWDALGSLPKPDLSKF